MKNVVKVSVGKLAFTFEEEAYQELKAYLDSLESHFEDNPSEKEIMEEIESRIAELLQDGMSGEDVVSVAKIREITAKLGSASDMDGGGNPAASSNDASDDRPKAPKKLYRDTMDKVLGGVCSGIAAYFGKEASLIRILAVVLALILGTGFLNHGHGIGLGSLVLIYLALWLIIPPAKTVDQRYSMRGETNDVDSIKRNIETGAHEIGQAAKDFDSSHPRFWHGFLRFWQMLFGFVLILAAFAYLFLLLMTSLGVSALMPATISLASAALVGPAWEMLFSISIFLVAFLPVIGMLYGGIQGVTGFKSPKWHPGLIIFIIWLASIVIISAFLAKIAIVDPDLIEVFRRDVLEAIEDFLAAGIVKC